MIKKVTINQDELLDEYMVCLKEKPYKIVFQLCSEKSFGKYINDFYETELYPGDADDLKEGIESVFSFSELQVGDIIFGYNMKFKLVQREWSVEDYSGKNETLLYLYFIPESIAWEKNKEDNNE